MSTLSALVLWFGSFLGGPTLAHSDCEDSWLEVDAVCELQRSAVEEEEDGQAEARDSRERPGQTWGFTISNGF